MRTETLEWLEETHRSSGYLFLNRYGERITTRGISQQLKNYADKYGLDKKVVYPHSFRHRYAKNFLEKYNDIALLADLMGHESIETTRIYLRRTASEQQALVDGKGNSRLLYTGAHKKVIQEITIMASVRRGW